jgi:hypothetical protein
LGLENARKIGWRQAETEPLRQAVATIVIDHIERLTAN